MSLSDALTDMPHPMDGKSLPRYEDLATVFEAALQKPERQPMSLREKLVHTTKYFCERVVDRIHGIDSPEEYDAGKTFLLSPGGQKYQFNHIKKGI